MIDKKQLDGLKCQCAYISLDVNQEPCRTCYRYKLRVKYELYNKIVTDINLLQGNVEQLIRLV